MAIESGFSHIKVVNFEFAMLVYQRVKQSVLWSLAFTAGAGAGAAGVAGAGATGFRVTCGTITAR
jgi:hypothetical protein